MTEAGNLQLSMQLRFDKLASPTIKVYRCKCITCAELLETSSSRWSRREITGDSAHRSCRPSIDPHLLCSIAPIRNRSTPEYLTKKTKVQRILWCVLLILKWLQQTFCNINNVWLTELPLICPALLWHKKTASKATKSRMLRLNKWLIIVLYFNSEQFATQTERKVVLFANAIVSGGEYRGKEGQMPPGTSRGEGERRCGNFFATRNIQKFCEICWGRDGYGRTNYVHRTVHILDAFNSVSRSSKFTKIVGGWGFVPDPTGEFTALPQTPG